MGHDNAPGKPVDKNPAHQTDETHGNIDAPQRTGNNIDQKDLSRGSEIKVGRKSRNRT